MPPTLHAPHTDAPTLVADHLPRTSDRDRRRPRSPFLASSSGRYLAVEDGDELVVIEIGSSRCTSAAPRPRT